MDNSGHKMTKFFLKGRFFGGCPFLLEKMPKIQRILKIYEGKIFQINFLILLCLNNCSPKIESTGGIAEVQTLL
jgi:hypothetical protein